MDVGDVVAIQQLIALSGHAVDAPDGTMLVDVFTADATYDGRASGSGLFEGRDAIAAWFARGKPPHPPSHNICNIHVYERAGETRVRSKWLAIDRRDGGLMSGDYDDLVVRTPDGWRIRARRYIFRYPEPDK